TRDDSSNTLSRLYYSFSINEGVNWSANIPLTPQWNSQIGWPNQNKIGDYYHMISDNNGASLAYAATFNSQQAVYFTRITPFPARATCGGDLTGNAIVDGSDIQLFVACQFGTVGPTCGCADMNGDGQLDTVDVLLFAVKLLTGGCP